MGSRPKRAGIRVFTDLDDARHGRLGVIGLDKVKVAVAFGPGQIGNEALVDTMRGGDDAALCGLAEHFGQAHDRHCAGGDDIGENLPGPYRGQLINVTDNEQRGAVRNGPQ